MEDQEYYQKTAKRNERLEKERERKEREERAAKEQADKGSSDVIGDQNALDSVENEDMEDLDFNGNKPRSKPKADHILLEVPRNIMMKTAMSHARFANSARNHTMTLADTIVQSGGKLEDFTLSKSSANRFRKKVVEEKAIDVREEFALTLAAVGSGFVVHFDGKIIEDRTDSTRSSQDRLAILLSSPSMSSEQLLGVPPVPNGTGEEVAEKVLEVFKHWGVTADHVVAMSFDTTASNTGVRSGACIKLESELGRKLLYLACHHHVGELHIKHVASRVGRPTKGNEDLLFKRFRENWNMINDGNMQDLQKFDFRNCSEFVAKEAKNALIYLSQCLLDKSFSCGDYKELCELAILFLGGHVRNFKFKLPGPVHHTRFMAKAIFYLKMALNARWSI